MHEKYFENERFEGVELNTEILEDHEFVDCEFYNCILLESKIVNCIFTECRFFHCDITEVKTENSEIRFGEFENCKLVGVNWSTLLSSGRFAEPIQKLKNCKLRYNHFFNMSLKKFDFSGSDLSGSMFMECILSETSFNGCPLDDTEFLKCDLRKADFRNAKGYKVDILSCQMKNAKFSYVEAVNLLGVLEIKLE